MARPSSQGLLCALETGISAGHVIDQALKGDMKPVVQFCQRVNEIYATYRRDLETYYAAEHRWSDWPFWSRRLPVSQHHISSPGSPKGND
jgi:hypothetical protein